MLSVRETQTPGAKWKDHMQNVTIPRCVTTFTFMAIYERH